MKTQTKLQTSMGGEETMLDHKRVYFETFKAYLDKQPGIVKTLHKILKVFAAVNFALVAYFFVTGLYWTFVWITTGALDQLGVSWANYGLSMSFLVFPWGLDIMLLRAWPTELQPISYSKPVVFRTGPMQILAGFGITAAGGPGAANMIRLVSEALQKFL